MPAMPHEDFTGRPDAYNAYILGVYEPEVWRDEPEPRAVPVPDVPDDPSYVREMYLPRPLYKHVWLRKTHLGWYWFVHLPYETPPGRFLCRRISVHGPGDFDPPAQEPDAPLRGYFQTEAALSLYDVDPNPA